MVLSVANSISKEAPVPVPLFKIKSALIAWNEVSYVSVGLVNVLLDK